MKPNEDDISNLSDDELDARQRAADGESADHNPTPGQGATEEDAAPRAAPAPAATEPATPPAEAAAAPAAGADAPAATEPEKVVGVASKDGGRVLPYSALQAERRSARAASSRAERAERELEDARKQLEDFKAGKTPETGELTEAEIADMEANFPEQGKKMRALYERAKAATPASATAVDEPTDDPIQEAIDQVPLLLSWQHEDAEKFERAQEIDAVLAKSPKWRDKPAVDRFTEVARQVADEFDIPFESKSSTKPPAAPAAAPKPAAPADVPRKPPETLSDFRGGSIADHGSIEVAKASPQALLGRMMEMSDEQMDAHLAKYG